MFKKIISFFVASLILLNIPSFALFYVSSFAGGFFSFLLFFLTFLLTLICFEKTNPKILYFSVVVFACYFVFSLINYSGSIKDPIILFSKTFFLLFGSFFMLKFLKPKHIIYILVVGGISVILDNFYFRFNDVQLVDTLIQKKRYAGFYLNPNVAAFIAILGYILVLVETKIYKSLLLFFTFVGLLTLSKYFFLSWALVNLVYLWYNKSKIFKYAFFLFSGLSILFYNSEKLNLDQNRLDLLYSLVTFSDPSDYKEVESRDVTWKKSIRSIEEKPVFGHGFEYFKEGKYRMDQEGVHNTFLLIFGESGFFPFFLFLFLIGNIFLVAFRCSRYSILPLLLTVAFSLKLLVTHNFFDLGIYIFLVSYIIFHIHKLNFFKK